METVKVLVGTIEYFNGDVVHDNTREVEFSGEVLARTERASTNNRGTKRVLYRTASGQLLVHRHCWSQWQNEGDSFDLREVDENELISASELYPLAKAAGLSRPLTLAEALDDQS